MHTASTLEEGHTWCFGGCLCWCDRHKINAIWLNNNGPTSLLATHDVTTFKVNEKHRWCLKCTHESCLRHSQGLWRSLKMDTCWSAKTLPRTMYCTKLLHHTYAKIWTLSFRRISAHHGIFLERKNTRPCIKVGCLRPAVTFVSPFFSPPNRPVLDLTVPFRSPVPYRDEEKGRKGKIPSPPSCTTSSSNEPPVKQKAENGCSQAPPQRPLVPLVSMIQL